MARRTRNTHTQSVVGGWERKAARIFAFGISENKTTEKRQKQFLLERSENKSDERISIYLDTKIPSFWVLTLYFIFFFF